MIEGTAVNAIAELAHAAQRAAEKTVEIGNRTYSTVPVHEVKVPRLPEPAVLTVRTLTGLVAYIAANRDELDFSQFVLHVSSPSTVDLVSRARGEYHQRFAYVQAANYDRFAAFPSFKFGQWLSPEDMNIALQALFENREQRAEVLQLLGNIRAEGEQSTRDNGVTQVVTVRAGVTLVANAPVPNPVILAPFRTFPEVEQPTSPFVLRVRKDERAGVQAALFEADGGAWRSTATASVARWLEEEVSDIPVIG